MLQIQFTLYTKILIFLSLLLFLLGYLFTNLMPALSGMLLLVFLVYAKNSFVQGMGEITVNRKILEKLRFVNHPVNVETTIKNNGGYLKIKATDVLPETATCLRGNNGATQLVKSGEEINLEYQISFSNRGNNTFESVELEFTDRWSLYTVNTTKLQKTSVMVHSDPDEVKKAKRVSSREYVDITAPSIVGTEKTHELEGIREYIPGDLMRDIDWKVTSRLQTLMTRTFQKKETIETVILLDCSRSMRRTYGKNSKLEHSTVLAIHLTNILQSIRHPVGLLAYDEFKVVNNISPTRSYQRIFEELANLPSIIKINGYKTKKPIETLEFKKEDPKENQRFLSTVYPFLARGKRTIKYRLQASGIYEAIRALLVSGKGKHLIIITDMETNVESLYSSINLAHSKKYKIWLLTFFSPYYNLDAEELTVDEIEELYKLQTSREKMLIKIKKKNIDVVELSPLMEGVKIIEEIRRK